MKIATLSIMVGSSACNLCCKYCISRTTYNISKKKELFVPSKELIDKAVGVFSTGGGFTALITGKGEPMLVPHEKLVALIKILYQYTPVVELQTNGNLLTNEKVKDMAKAGLSTVVISCASCDDEFNYKVMSGGLEKRWDLKEICKLVIDNNLVLRLAVVSVRDGIYNIPTFLNTIKWLKALASRNYPLQLTIRRMGMPSQHRLRTVKGREVAKFIRANKVDTISIWNYLKENGEKIITFPWGSEVFDYQGVAVCISDCLTIKPEEDTIRTAILYPDGHLRYSWEFPSAVIF